jgi:hypothetical protein
MPSHAHEAVQQVVKRACVHKAGIRAPRRASLPSPFAPCLRALMDAFDAISENTTSHEVISEWRADVESPNPAGTHLPPNLTTSFEENFRQIVDPIETNASHTWPDATSAQANVTDAWEIAMLGEAIVGKTAIAEQVRVPCICAADEHSCRMLPRTARPAVLCRCVQSRIDHDTPHLPCRTSLCLLFNRGFVLRFLDSSVHSRRLSLDIRCPD